MHMNPIEHITQSQVIDILLQVILYIIEIVFSRKSLDMLMYHFFETKTILLFVLFFICVHHALLGNMNGDTLENTEKQGKCISSSFGLHTLRYKYFICF